MAPEGVAVAAAMQAAAMEAVATAAATVVVVDMEAALMTTVRSMVPPKVAATVQVGDTTIAVDTPPEHAEEDIATLSGSFRVA